MITCESLKIYKKNNQYLKLKYLNEKTSMILIYHADKIRDK